MGTDLDQVRPRLPRITTRRSGALAITPDQVLRPVALARQRRRLSATGWRSLVEDSVRVADIVGLAGAGALASAWRFGGDQAVPPAVLAALTVGCLLAIIVLPHWQVYSLERLRSPGADLLRVVAGWAVTVAALLAALFAMKASEEVSRLWVGAWFLTGAAALVGVRLAARVALTRGELARVLVRRVALVGSGDRLAAAERLAGADPTMRVAAVLDLDGGLAGRWPAQATPLAGFGELEARVRAGAIDQVLLAVPARSEEVLESSLERLRHLPIDVSMTLGPPSTRVPLLGVTRVGDVLLIRLLERPIDGWRYVLKSAEDLVLACLLLVLATPIMLLAALAVRLDSPGPVLYRQQRRGFAGEPIAMLKFRTMYADLCDAPDAALVRQATQGDPRVTRVGRFLRRTSLDELPQLLNVLWGDMSVVGPRPHAVAHDDHYSALIDEYLGRHKVKPGITGWAQVNGFRGETRTVDEMRQRIELDLEYIGKWSLALDMRVLAFTLLVGFRHRRAY